MIFGLGKRAKPLILHIDDDPDIVALVMAVLKGKGADGIFAYNAAEGFALARKEKPDVILLDISMPMTDGFETCRALKNDPKTKKIPILMLTARSQMKDVEKALGSGAEGYLAKPFAVPQLLEKLGAWVTFPK
jgi:two-component system cell cycle response regulator